MYVIVSSQTAQGQVLLEPNAGISGSGSILSLYFRVLPEQVAIRNLCPQASLRVWISSKRVNYFHCWADSLFVSGQKSPSPMAYQPTGGWKSCNGSYGIKSVGVGMSIAKASRHENDHGWAYALGKARSLQISSVGICKRLLVVDERYVLSVLDVS